VSLYTQQANITLPLESSQTNKKLFEDARAQYKKGRMFLVFLDGKFKTR
jgi:hypothetical protein